MPETSRSPEPSRAAILRRMLPAALASAGLLSAMLVPVTATDARWSHPEWATGSIGTLDCTAAEGFASRTTGRVLSGTLAGQSLDPVVSLSGIVVSNDGETSSAEPASSTVLGDDAYTSPLELQAIDQLISAELSAALPLNAGVGVYSHYGQAKPDGVATGASGVITDRGAIDFDAVRAGTAPSMGTLRLSDLPGLGAALNGITDLSLELGAVASSATVDGCEEEWSGSAAAVDRDYLVSGLGMDLESPAVAALSTTASTAVGTLVRDVNGLLPAVEAELGAEVVAGLGTLLNGLLNDAALSVGTVTIDSLDIELDAAPLSAVLNAPLTDGAVTIDLSRGTVSLDLAALVGEIHRSSDGLNGLKPNTPVLSAEVMTAIVERVSRLLRDPATETGLLYDLERVASKMVLDASISIEASAFILARVLGATVDAVDVGVTIDGSVGGLIGRSGYAAPDIDVSAAVLNSGLLGLLLAPVNALVATILGSLEGLIVEDLLPVLAATLESGLVAPAAGLVGTMTGTLLPAVTTVLDALDRELALVSQLVSITVNSQPDQPPEPAAPHLLEPREYAVSALRIGVVDGPSAGAASLLDLFIASSTAGSTD